MNPGGYGPLVPDGDGVFRSRHLAGPCVDPAELLADDRRAVFRRLQSSVDAVGRHQPAAPSGQDH